MKYVELRAIRELRGITRNTWNYVKYVVLRGIREICEIRGVM